MDASTIDPMDEQAVADLVRERYEALFSAMTVLTASRQRSLAITNLEQSRLWFEEDQRFKTLGNQVEGESR